MSELLIRDGKFDVVLAAAPGVEVWPSAGVRALTSLCADVGLSVGLFGGEDLRVKGVVPLDPGGVALVEDPQRRIHRIQARAIVKVSPVIDFPDPFPGWRSPGFIPIMTALRLREERVVHWDPCTVILGTGNRALRFGTDLLQAGAREVFCVESNARKWGNKPYAGWEVERRRFEMAGGKLIEAKPLKLSQKSAMLWEFRLQDAQGVRILEAARVISAGPYRLSEGVREHPAGSLLFELEQTAPNIQADNVQGWKYEEERARWLAVKIARALLTDIGSEKREELDRIYKRARGRLRRYNRHLEEPFAPTYQGKWMASQDSRRVRSFSGVPVSEHKLKPIASVECIEDIGCDICQRICPTRAIQISPRPDPATGGLILKENQCTSCGLCLLACPSEAISMVHEPEERSMSKLTLPSRGQRPWKEGESAVLLNRRGDALGSARIISLLQSTTDTVQLVQLDVPAHLVWEARSLRRPKSEAAQEEAFFESLERSSASETKVEITLDGEKRLARDQVSLTSGLFEMGFNRPEDALYCRDGSCGLCEVLVDGNKVLACQTDIRRGMALKLKPSKRQEPQEPNEMMPYKDCLCTCLGITREDVVERLKSGRLRSPEAVLEVTHVGSGKCHGELCMEPFRRLLIEQGVEIGQWIDWRFPWSEWLLGNS